MGKNVTHTVRISVSEYETIARIASSEERTVCNLLSVWVKRALREHLAGPVSGSENEYPQHHEVPR
jgi:transposase-like protein